MNSSHIMKKRLILTHSLPLDIDQIMSQQFDVEVISFQDLIKEENINCDALISILTDELTSENLARFSNLKIIAQFAVGVNNIDLAYCRKHQITVCHTPDVLTEASADLTFALLNTLSRRVHEAANWAQAGQWKNWDAQRLLGRSLHGANLGIVGMGKIGEAFAKLCQRSFGMKIFYHNRQNKSLEWAQYLTLEDLFKNCDIVSVHTPLTQETRKLIGKKEFQLMPDDAIFLNTSRGEVIDQEALIECLEAGKFFGVGLDVMTPEPLPPNSPLYHYERVLITPHIGSAEKETRESMAWLCWRNCEEVLNERHPMTPVPESFYNAAATSSSLNSK